MRVRPAYYGILRRWTVALLALVAAMTIAGWYSMWTPGRSHRGPLAPLGIDEQALARRLARHVDRLAGEIGERNLWRPGALEEAARYVETEFAELKLPVELQTYDVEPWGRAVRNVGAELGGASRPDEIVVIGAHYDSVLGCPGANDNATGVAALIELARAAAVRRPARTLRFVGFVNEEPPFFQTPDMGSLRYARRARERGERIAAMISLETIGYYTDAANSQQYPFPFSLFYPSTGDFIAFVANLRSRALLHQAIGSFRRHARFPSEGAAAPAGIAGIGWSDHWAFWQQGYPALMITDTALFRYPHYHTALDMPDKIDYPRMARLVAGLAHVVDDLTR
jgi:Zn-dependent M28 family amino/carboxypeptidase